jgi:hypothetical protein
LPIIFSLKPNAAENGEEKEMELKDGRLFVIFLVSRVKDSS